MLKTAMPSCPAVLAENLVFWSFRPPVWKSAPPDNSENKRRYEGDRVVGKKREGT